MIKNFALLWAILIGFAIPSCFGQIKRDLNGSIQGLAKDTTHKYVLRSAGVTILDNRNSELIAYQTTNPLGEFKLDNLPVDIPLKLKISHVGYRIFERDFVIERNKRVKDFGVLALTPLTNDLEEVVIKIEPISMNNDTLEINTAGFKLDSNAVIEDVLRRTPGMTLWGDGSITFNGKDVKKVYVDGKPFFGGNSKIALQNLSKDAVQKIQIFEEQLNSESTDSSLVMNLKLKSNMKTGLFGKIGVGLGTDKRFDNNANLSFYNNKLQISTVASANNVNKFASSGKILLENSTFKGVDVTVQHQPDFKIPGLNRTKSTGAYFSYNFLDNPTTNRKSNLSLDYFLDDRIMINSTNTVTKSSLGNSIERSSASIAISDLKKDDYKINGIYEYENENYTLLVEQHILSATGSISQQTQTESLIKSGNPVSSNLSSTKNRHQNSQADLGIKWRIKSNKETGILNGMSVKYLLSNDNRQGKIVNSTNFNSYTDPSSSQLIERLYDTKLNNFTNGLELDLPRLVSIGKQWIAGIKSILHLVSSKDFDIVDDVDSNTGNLISNKGLTNQLNGNIFDHKVMFSFGRFVDNKLSNRYSKETSFSISVGSNHITQNNTSSHLIQYVRRTYNNLFGGISLTTKHVEYGDFSQNISLKYSNEIDIPQIAQLAPLTDNLNVYNTRLPNLNLTEAKKHSLNFVFERFVLKSRNPFNFGLNINAYVTTNAFADSSFVRDDDRTFIYTINVKKNSILTANANLKKAFKMKINELQIKLNAAANVGFYPGYINNQYNTSKVSNLQSNISLFYRYQNKLGIDWSIGYNLNTLKQDQFKKNYETKGCLTEFNINYLLTKKLTLGSSVSYSKIYSNIYEAKQFVVLNANLTYRFLKLNNGEIKFSALDLLRQNNNIFNLAYSNGIQSGTQNMIKQYFITTVSYYPRIFGKKKN